MMYEEEIANYILLVIIQDWGKYYDITTSVCAAKGLSWMKDAGIGVFLRMVINELSGGDGRFICLSPGIIFSARFYFRLITISQYNFYKWSQYKPKQIETVKLW